MILQAKTSTELFSSPFLQLWTDFFHTFLFFHFYTDSGKVPLEIQHNSTSMSQLNKKMYSYVRNVAAVTHSVGSHARIAGLGGLACGSWSWGSLVLGISALAGSGLGSLRHGEGRQESLWVQEAEGGGVRNRGVNRQDRRGWYEREGGAPEH